jgi:hypothetical protein
MREPIRQRSPGTGRVDKVTLVLNMFIQPPLCGFVQAFLYRKRPLQQNGDMRKRNGKEDYICVESRRLQGHPLSPPPPSRCDNGGSLPAFHFRPPPLPQILATSLKVEDGLPLGVYEFGS